MIGYLSLAQRQLTKDHEDAPEQTVRRNLLHSTRDLPIETFTDPADAYAAIRVRKKEVRLAASIADPQDRDLELDPLGESFFIKDIRFHENFDGFSRLYFMMGNRLESGVDRSRHVSLHFPTTILVRKVPPPCTCVESAIPTSNLCGVDVVELFL
jgi:hypothetical protein